jgi:hypothetical protein
MIPCGTIIREVCDQLQKPYDTGDAIWRRQARSKVAEAYRDVCGQYNWSDLQPVATLTDGLWVVPADCRGILRVSDSNRNPYNHMAGHNRRSDYLRNWYFNAPVATPLSSGTTLNVGEYATAISSTAEFPASTCVNEYIRIGDNVGLYRIATYTGTSDLVLADNFRGDSLSSAMFQIRPKGTPILAFCDNVGVATTPTGIEIQYVRYPLPLHRDEDICELPGYAPAVKTKALMKLLALMGFSKAAQDLTTTYRSDLSEMKSVEPSTTIIQPTNMFRRGRGRGVPLSYLRGLELLNEGA